MKPGTIIKLPDGRIGTIVYHSLTGYGFIWGQHTVPTEKLLESCPLFDGENDPDVEKYQPQAMLREPVMTERLGIECVGEDYEIVAEAGTEQA